MSFLHLKTADLVLGYDLRLISNNIFQIPYKYHAFLTDAKKSDIELRFYFIDRETLSAAAAALPVLYSGKGFRKSYEFRKCRKGILYLLRKDGGELVFSALIWHSGKAIIVLHDYTKTHGTFAFEQLGRLLPFSLIRRQALVLHGVLMEYAGKGVILSAPSGTGKSTHAHLWRDHFRALIVNGDRSLCRKKAGVWMGYGMPWCGSSGEYINREVPIRAIVVLQQAEQNEVRRLPLLEGFQRMYGNIMFPLWDRAVINEALDLFDDMCAEIPVYLLKCRPETEAAELLKREIDQL